MTLREQLLSTGLSEQYVTRILSCLQEEKTPWFCTVVYPPEGRKTPHQVYNVHKKMYEWVKPKNVKATWDGQEASWYA